MSTLRLTAESSQLVSEVRKARQELKLAEAQYKENQSAAELLGTKEEELSEKMKAANKVNTQRREALNKYQAAINNLKKEINEWKTKEQELISKLKDAEEAEDKNEQEIKELTEALTDLQKQISNNEKELTGVERSFFATQTAINKTTKEVRDFEDESNNTTVSVVSMQDAFSTAADGLRAFGDRVDGVNDKIKDFVKNGIKATVEALKDLGSYSLTTGIGFESAMSELMATMGMGTDSAAYGRLKETAEYYGRTTKYSATEAAQGLNILAQAGLTVEEQISTIGTVLDLAAAGALSLDTAASYVTASIKGFGDEMSNAAYYADLIAKGAAASNTNTNMMGAAFSNAASDARSYGQDAEGLALSLLRLAEQNIVGTDAATALNRAMADLYTPTTAAKEALDALGISAYDLTTGKAKDFNLLIDQINYALSGMTEEEANTYKNLIFTTNGLQAFNKMTVTSIEKVTEFKDILADAGGAAADMSITMSDNLKGSLDNFESAAEGFGIKIYDNIVPGVRQAVDHSTEYISKLTDNFDNNGLGAAVGKISVAFSNFANKIPTLLQAHTPTIIKLFEGIANIIVVILNYLPILIDDVLPQLLNVVDGLLSKLPAFLEQVMPTLIDGIGWLISNFPILVTSLQSIQAFSGIGAGLLDFGGIAAGFGMMAKSAGVSLGSIAAAALPVIAAIGAIMAAVGTLVGIFTTAITTSESFRSYLGSLWNGIKEDCLKAFEGMSNAIVRFCQGLGFEVSSINDVLNGLVTGINTIATVISFVISQAITLYVKFQSFIMNAAVDLVESLQYLITGLILTSQKDFDGALEYFKRFGDTVSTSFTNTFNNVREDARDLGYDFGEFLTQLKNVTNENPLKVRIESDIDVESFKNDISMIASWGLPGFDPSKYESLFMMSNGGKGWNSNVDYSYVEEIMAGIENATANISNTNNNRVTSNQNDNSVTQNLHFYTTEPIDTNEAFKQSRDQLHSMSFTAI